jgi:predicted kinase
VSARQQCTGALPLLVVVSGPPGSGTTTLAHTLARAIPCPAISRDEIKEGLVNAMDAYAPAQGDDLSLRTLDVFFGIVGALVNARVSLVAEAAFQHGLWAPGLTPLLERARIHIVRCRVDPAVAWERINRRAAEQPVRRLVHGDPSLDAPFESFVAKLAAFEPVALPVPTIEVDTSVGLDPSLEAILGLLSQAEDPSS